jgi:type II secretory pathway pseudopilin PulG
MRNAPSSRGFTLVEASVAGLILVFTLALAGPSFQEILSQFMLRQACRDVSTLCLQAQTLAAFHRKDVGIRWVMAGGDVTVTGYEDGNGNGVLSQDIRSGVDRPVFGPISLKGRHPSISFSFIPGFDGLDLNREPIGDLSDPIRFGRSSISTFTPIGHASPGSVYLSNERKRQGMVRISPISGQIKVYEWFPTLRQWVNL